MRARGQIVKKTTAIIGAIMLAVMTTTPITAMTDDTEALEPGACGDSATIIDTGLSTFVGGDLTYKNAAEVEGSVVVDVHNAIGMLAGHVMWGMGVEYTTSTRQLMEMKRHSL